MDREANQPVLGAFFQRLRLERGWTLGQAATHCGYRNLNRGANRLHRLETEGQISEQLFRRLAFLYGLDRESVGRIASEAVREARRRWLRWSSEPLPQFIRLEEYVTCAGCLLVPSELRDETDEPLGWAKWVARKEGPLELFLNRRISVLINRRGGIRRIREARIFRSHLPYLRISGATHLWLHDAEETAKLRIREPAAPPAFLTEIARTISGQKRK